MRLPHRLQGQKVKSQSHGAGAYCGGHLAAQLIIIIRPADSLEAYYYYYYYYYYYTRIHNAPTFSSDRLLNRRRLLMLKRLTIRYCSPTLVLSNYMINGCRV